MAKRKISVACGCDFPPAVMPEDQQKSEFKKRYEFNKLPPARSPTTGWEYAHLTSNGAYAPKKEISLVRGEPHKFKNVRTGNSYGTRKAIVRSK